MKSFKPTEAGGVTVVLQRDRDLVADRVVRRSSL
jgi:hypothetical protein